MLGSIGISDLDRIGALDAFQRISDTTLAGFLNEISEKYPNLAERLRPRAWEENNLRAEFSKDELIFDDAERALKTKFKLELPERLLETWSEKYEFKPVIKVETHLRLQTGLIEVYLPIKYNIIIERIGYMLAHYLKNDLLEFRRVRFDETHLDGWINWVMFKELRSARFKEVQKGNLRNVYFNGFQLTEDPDYKAYRENNFGRLHAISFLAETSLDRTVAISINGDKGKITVFTEDLSDVERAVDRAEEILAIKNKRENKFNFIKKLFFK